MKLSPSVFRSLIFLFFSLSVVTMQAQESKRVIPDSIRISLLTCASGEEIYSLFGHTAIRYENYTRGIDAVFNYGIFNFNAPNFILRFALGETDYQLGVTDYERFAAEYYYLERDVWQQELNLTVQEKGKLVMLLEENYRPENRNQCLSCRLRIAAYRQWIFLLNRADVWHSCRKRSYNDISGFRGGNSLHVT